MTLTHFLTFGFCQNCEKTRDLNKHGRCSLCNSDAIQLRKPYVVPDKSVIDELLELEAMFRIEKL